MPDDTSCLRWVVKTRDGYLGPRRYDYGMGSTIHDIDRSLDTARLFNRKADAEKYAGDGRKVLPVSVKLIPEFHSDG